MFSDISYSDLTTLRQQRPNYQNSSTSTPPDINLSEHRYCYASCDFRINYRQDDDWKHLRDHGHLCDWRWSLWFRYFFDERHVSQLLPMVSAPSTDARPASALSSTNAISIKDPMDLPTPTVLNVPDQRVMSKAASLLPWREAPSVVP